MTSSEGHNEGDRRCGFASACMKGYDNVCYAICRQVVDGHYNAESFFFPYINSFPIIASTASTASSPHHQPIPQVLFFPPRCKKTKKATQELFLTAGSIVDADASRIAINRLNTSARNCFPKSVKSFEGLDSYYPVGRSTSMSASTSFPGHSRTQKGE